MFSWQEQIRSLRCSFVRYCCCHSNIKFISSRHRVISSVYILNFFCLLTLIFHDPWIIRVIRQRNFIFTYKIFVNVLIHWFNNSHGCWMWTRYNISNTRKSVLSDIQTLKKWVEKTRHSRVFLNQIEVFRHLMKHTFECLILASQSMNNS